MSVCEESLNSLFHKLARSIISLISHQSFPEFRGLTHERVSFSLKPSGFVMLNWVLPNQCSQGPWGTSLGLVLVPRLIDPTGIHRDGQPPGGQNP